MSFTIAIVGRPNVGKSTLFNRLVGRRIALVDDRPGVTRDRREGEARLFDLAFRVIDTAGLEESAPDSLTTRMRKQTETAIEEADLVLFLIDSRAGLTPADAHFADLVRRSGKPALLLANKAEGRAGAAGALESFALGFGDPIAISAEHGEGLGDLHEALLPFLPETEEDAAEATGPKGPLKVAIIGRPNTGKSTLVNRLIGEERLLTGPEAGITRDAIAIDWSWTDGKSGTIHPIRLFDTAGMRRKSRIDDRLERLSVGDTLKAVRFAECVVVVIDVTQPFEKQDLQIVDLIVEEGRALVLAVSKWDTVKDKAGTLKRLRETTERLLPQIKGVALVPVSGLSGSGLDRLMQAVIAADVVWNRRIATAKLNRWLADMIAAHPPPAPGGRRVKLRYMTQANARPPTFIAFTTRPDDLPDAYVRYLVNGLRETFKLAGTPIRLHLRKSENPYVREG